MKTRILIGVVILTGCADLLCDDRDCPSGRAVTGTPLAVAPTQAGATVEGPEACGEGDSAVLRVTGAGAARFAAPDAEGGLTVRDWQQQYLSPVWTEPGWSVTGLGFGLGTHHCRAQQPHVWITTVDWADVPGLVAVVADGLAAHDLAETVWIAVEDEVVACADGGACGW